MKKFLTIIIAVAMVFTLAVCAFAETENVGNTGGSDTLPTSTNGSKPVTVGSSVVMVDKYRVDVEWQSLDFTYTTTSTWNTTELDYDHAGSWSAGKTIKVANRSSKAIKVTPNIVATDDAISGVTPAVTPTSATIDTLAGTGSSDLASVTNVFTVSVTGNGLLQKQQNNTVIANVNLALSPDNP